MTMVRGSARLPNTRKPQMLLSISEAERAAFFSTQSWEALAELGEVRVVEPSELRDLERFAELTEGVGILITAWGVPQLSEERLALLPDLGLVMHAASSVRAIVSEAFWATGIPISQAGAAMSPAVAELSLSFTLSLLRRTHRLDHALRSGASWEAARDIARARGDRGARIGVIGASRTGRAYIDACRALGAAVMVYDPYVLPGDSLAPLTVDLDELLERSEVVAVHAPATPETEGMIGAAQIAALRDGALFVNTARSTIVDMDALYDAVASGRIDAALDVFDEEPLPQGDRWRSLAEVPCSPATPRRRNGRIARIAPGGLSSDEIRRHLGGDALQYAGHSRRRRKDGVKRPCGMY